MSLADIRSHTVIVMFAGYVFLNYGFMLIGLPFGIPIGDVCLILSLATINLPIVFKRMSGAVNLTPFLIWWCFGLGRTLLDGLENGVWALRDAAQVIESLWLIVAFVFARSSENLDRLFRWLKWLCVIWSFYALGWPIQETIQSMSPSVPAASTGSAVAIFGTYGNIGTMLLLTAFYLGITQQKSRLARNAANATAGLFVGIVVVTLQARTLYLQLIALLCILMLFRPQKLRRFAMLLPIMFIALGTVIAFSIKVPGRLTDEISFSFFIEHFAAIGGVVEGDDDSMKGAAQGVPQRLDWWKKIMDQEWADPAKLITGLGYGEPLTDFVQTNGAKVREPHNSFMSVLGRLGMIGAISWIWLHVELFGVWRRVFAYYRRVKDQLWMDRLLLMLAFIALTLAEAIGEDALEKPYNIVPYYLFWGIILGLGANKLAARKPVRARAGYYTAE